MSKLVTVARFRDLPEAELARGRLEAEGIPAFLADHYLVGLNWTYSYALGGVKLQVPRESAATARELLDSDDSAAVPESQPPDVVCRANTCPSCGSAAVRERKLSRKSGAFSLLVGLPVLFWGTRLSCEQCGHSWRAERLREPFPDIPAAAESDEAASSSAQDKERTWGDDLPWAILILMFVVSLVMLYRYAN